MEIKLNTSHSYYHSFYRDDTVLAWQSFWLRLCRMSYLREKVVNKLVVFPGDDHDNEYYARRNSQNYNEITLDHTWKEFCKSYKGDVMVVPELEELYVPESLFMCLGVSTWFAHSFPNCKITYWE